MYPIVIFDALRVKICNPDSRMVNSCGRERQQGRRARGSRPLDRRRRRRKILAVDDDVTEKP